MIHHAYLMGLINQTPTIMSENEIILTHILNCRSIDLILKKPVLTHPQQQQFESYKVRRKNGEPLQYILGCCEFYGLEFKVDKRVLIPRPETEVLVEMAIQRVASRTGPAVLDLGTGSGNIAIALAKFCPQVKVTTVDISKDALDVARDNAVRHGVDGRINFVHADMVEYLNVETRHCLASTTKYDLIISNPPYIPTEQMKVLPRDVQQEPRLALEAGEDGLKFYRDIIKYTPPLLREGGYLMMEFGDGQAKPIQALFDPDFTVDIFKDLVGKERFLMARRI